MTRYATVEGTGGSRAALARSLRLLRERVHILVQHGHWTSPRRHLPALHMLDRFVVQVKWDERQRSWHPKVCLLRFVSADGKGDVRWRLWLGSRNFTRDRSWDLALVLDGAPAGKGTPLAGVGTLASRLALQAGVEKPWRASIKELADVRWTASPGIKIDQVQLDLPGDDRKVPVLPADTTRVVVVSPFLDARALRIIKSELAKRGPLKQGVLTLVSTEAALADMKLRKGALDGYDLHVLPPSDQEAPSQIDADDNRSEDVESEAIGLHAKFFWIERPGQVRLLLGSTNLTARGWLENAEARVELSMQRRGSREALELRGGIEAFLNTCTKVEVADLPTVDTVARRTESRFNRLRNALSAQLLLRQLMKGDGTVLVTSERAPQLPSNAQLRIARLGDAWLDWPVGTSSVELPTAADHDNSDSLQLELEWGRHVSNWLQSAPFNPPQDTESRDRALLQGMLGLEGLLALLNDMLGGDAAGSKGARQHWDEESQPKGQFVRLLGIEAVLAAWARNKETLREVAQIVAMTRDFQPRDVREQKAHAQLQEFLASWDAVESELLRK
ncbi:hypothetical protein M2282_005957 [Variovorax boronicumulans]|uniref:phospholipase D family protein n=1 Tax=Variovorax boronicumulans TaxID=436515 RepID=UPI002476E6ED|nr:phospholipase D family protein [Variovorax boronicumulans]MDH6170779.1 hypothetical protein [Variovorax boronicumulans]